MTQDAIESLLAAVRAAPEDLVLRGELASALEEAGELARALEQYEALRARGASASLGPARCLAALGRASEALLAYDEAVAADVSLADVALRERIRREAEEPRARIRLVAEGGERHAAASPGAVEQPTLTFAEVGGLEELKEKIRLRVLYPLKRPDLYQAFGKRVGGGLLLYGPPGCGKTYLARATAGEAKIHFVAVGIEEVLDMWLGQSEKKLHELFASARAQAPSILFFDEVDALGGRRSGLRHESYRTLVTQFLSELDGAKGAAEGVLVIGATNAPWDLDPAFRRPGRFSEVLFVPPPDLRARVEILKLKLAGKPVAAGVDVTELARAAELYSGADLDQVVQSAIEGALAESLRGGAICPIDEAALRTALERRKPTTLEWFATAKNFATYANEAGQFDEVLAYLKRHRL